MEHGWVYGMQAKNGSRKGSGLAPGAGWFPTRDRAESPAAWESAPGTRDEELQGGGPREPGPGQRAAAGESPCMIEHAMNSEIAYKNLKNTSEQAFRLAKIFENQNT